MTLKNCLFLLLLLIFSFSSQASNNFSTTNSSSRQNQLNLPGLGTTAGIVSHQREYEIGRAWLRMYRSRVPHYDDPELAYYLEHLLARLASHSPLPNKTLQLILVSNPTINAFAAPGGIIGVHSGLFLMAESEGELASVLSHELAHLSQRHWVRSVEAARQKSLPTMAGLLAGLILLATSNGEAGMAAITSVQAASLESSLRFSRQNEREADNLGMHTLVDAGFNPNAMPAMFEQMLKAQRFHGKRPPEYLLSHPVTEKRIADSRAREMQMQHTLMHSSNELSYHLMRARIQVHHSETPQMAVKRFKSELSGSSLNVDASRYGLALAYIQTRQFDLADALLKQLLKEHPQQINFRLAQAQAALQSHHNKQATDLLLKLKKQQPHYFPINLLLAKTYTQAQQYTEAGDVLRRLSQQRPEDPQIWYELAEVYGLAKNIPLLHLARAEYFILHGIYDKARKQLLYAEPLLEDDHVHSARIKQRLIEIDKLENASLEI